MIRESRAERSFQVANVVLLGFIAVVTLYPILYVLFASVSDPNQLIRHSGALFKPLGFELEAYKIVFKNPDIGSGYVNTLLYMGVGTAISMVLTIMGAYALSRTHAMFVKYVMFFAAFTMWFKPSMIPFFLTVGTDMHMKNTFWAMVLPRAIVTYNLIVLRTGFAAVPESLEESARIDGAKDFTILFRVFVPLCMANIAVVTLFYMVSKWNSWFDAMLFINKRNMFPLQLLLREILILNSTDSMLAASAVSQGDQISVGETIKYATIVVATLPILCVYPFVQKYFVKGVMIGAIKG